MSWHYQIYKRTDTIQPIFEIVEVYSSDPSGVTETGLRPRGATREELLNDLERMLKDAREYPVLGERE